MYYTFTNFITFAYHEQETNWRDGKWEENTEERQKGWEKRWVVLDENILRVYLHKVDSQENKIIELKISRLDTTSGNKEEFKLFEGHVTKDRTIFSWNCFQSESLQSSAGWKEELKRSMNKIEKNILEGEI